MRTLTVTADFTDDELAEVVAVIRSIDDRRPTARFQITIGGPERCTLADAERSTRHLFPKRPGRISAWRVIVRDKGRG